jgi:anion-transporting  ArsA/GET3 family ATPase
MLMMHINRNVYSSSVLIQQVILSDALNQKLSKTLTLVNGVPSQNLWAMEIDTTIEMENNDMLVDTETKNSILELASTVPGIDEAVVG